jgi:hypothetical protein
MKKKEISARKRCVLVLCMGLLFWSSLSGFEGEVKPKNDPVQDRTDPLSFRLTEFRLTPAALNSTPNNPLFTLALKQAGEQDQEERIFSFPQIKGKGPRIFETLPKSEQRFRLEETLYTASLLSLTALNIADYVSTLKALQHQELQEANPLMKPFTKNIIVFSAIKIGLTFYDFYVLKKIYKKNKIAGWILSAIGNFAMSYVVSNNLKKIRAVTQK